MTASADPAARLAEGYAQQEAGRLDEAEACFLDVLAAQATHTEAMRALAVVAVMRGDLDQALDYAEAAVALEPAGGDSRHLLGRIQLDRGEPEAALATLEAAARFQPSDPFNLRLDIGAALGQMGQWDRALALAEGLLAGQPDNPYALYAAGNAAEALGQDDAALAYFERGIAAHPNEWPLSAAAAKLYRERGERARAWEAIERALALAPHDANIHYMARVIRGELVPAWQFNMMNDAQRNAAFKAAFARRLAPGDTVLEIGTGAGLLAMMAARRGARVYTCESNPAIAMAARSIVAHNKMDQLVNVLAKPSFEVAVGADLPRPADVLVAEIFSAQLLSEDVIPTLEDAKRRLLKPGGTVVPAAAVMVGALVSNPELGELARVGTVEGFDLGAFSAFSPVMMNLDVPNLTLAWLSEPADLFTFDFQGRDEWPAESAFTAVEVTADGLCQGVVQWIRLALDDAVTYENVPGGARATRTKHWTPLFYPFTVPRPLQKGQSVTLRIAHDRKGARIELAGIE